MQIPLFDLPPSNTKSVGGSEVAALFGLSPWMTPEELWRLKTDRPLEHTLTRAQRRGTRLEPLVCRAFELHAGVTLGDGVRVKHRRWASGVRMIAATDGTLPGGGIFEAKTTRRGGDKHATFAAGSIPTVYALQLQHYAATLGVDHGVIACLAGPGGRARWRLESCDFYAVAWTAVDAVGALLEEAVAAFFEEHVMADVPPGWERHERADALLNLLEGADWIGPSADSTPAS